MRKALNDNDVAILQAVHDGDTTAAKIRPRTTYETTDGLHTRCKQLCKLGYMRTWTERTRINNGSRPWGSRPEQRLYQLTDEGEGLLSARVEKRTTG